MYGEIIEPEEDFGPENIDDGLVYSFYLGIIPQTGKMFKSPFRVNGKTERTPSFNFFVKEGKILFKCFSTGYGGDCIHLVRLLKGLSFRETILKIKEDLYSDRDLHSVKIQGRDVPIDEIHRIDRTEKPCANIQVKTREYDLDDIIYWSQYGVTKEDLIKWNIKPCDEVWLNDAIWYTKRKKDPCYRYVINDKYKVYRPRCIGKGKWLTNSTKGDVQGVRYLPEKGELLVITKSYKDIVVLNKHLGVNAISFSSESEAISEKTIDYLYTRFDNIVLWYDNDQPGIEQGELRSEQTGLPNVYIPIEYKATDPSDLYKTYGKEVFTEVSRKLLNI
jgi:hypothetical protein